MTPYQIYEDLVTCLLEEAGMTRSDAQGVAEAHEELIEHGFMNGIDVSEVANEILNPSQK